MFIVYTKVHNLAPLRYVIVETRKGGPPKNSMEFNKKKIPIKHERQKKKS